MYVPVLVPKAVNKKLGQSLLLLVAEEIRIKRD